MSALPLRTIAVASALLAAGAPGPAAALPADAPFTGAAFAAEVEQPRPYGYLIGDLLTQRVRLRLEGDPFEPARLPSPGRIGAWFERRAARIVRDARGERWLAVEYQVINVPPLLATVQLPAWKIAPRAGDRGLLVDAAPIAIAPLAPPAQDGDTIGALRPDRPAPLVDLAPIRRRIAGWSAALLATLAIWAAWLAWRDWRARTRLPFAQALRELGRIDDSLPAAWQVLHRAFDRTAGRATQTATLAALFERAPHLEALRPQIEQFYDQSAALFFGGTAPANPVRLRALCGALRRIERRHER